MRINEKRLAMISLMREYLKTELGDCGIFVGETERCSLEVIKDVYMNACGIYFKGCEPGRGEIVREIIPFKYSADVGFIFRACIRHDEDFKAFFDSYKN